MAKVITFAQQFLQGHPREGERTYFPKYFLNSLNFTRFEKEEDEQLHTEMEAEFCHTPRGMEKKHTIRAGTRWKVGDKFSPRIWTGRPYFSKQMKLCPDMEIVKTYDFTIEDNGYYLNGQQLNIREVVLVANNDGLLITDFEGWFKKTKSFTGQIICWIDPKYDKKVLRL